MDASVNDTQLLLRLTAILYAGENINLYEFRSLDGTELPAFTAGSHVDLNLPNKMVRQYSLANSQDEKDRYVVGVKRDPASRGGSSFLHERARVGDLMKVGLPRNNFRLFEEAPHSVFVAGGIGVTPLRCMVDRMEALGQSWELHYSVRKRSEAIFLKEFESYGPRFHLHVDEEAPGTFLDIASIVAAAPPGSHFYCCGPLPMLRAFEASTAGWPADQVHVEYFSSANEVAVEGGFTVRLAKSGKDVVVAPGQTILDAVQLCGIDVPFSCGQGVCGACETKVLDGIPDHRDMILTEQERAANRSMMICCSGSKSGLLVLDL